MIFILENKNRQKFLKVRVDGCQIVKGCKCDYLLVNTVTGDEYFVDLKGKDVGHALEQLEGALTKLSDKTNVTKSTKSFAIVKSVYPKLSTKIQVYKKKFKETYKSSLDIKENRYSISA